jgi:hypothetical protein
MRERYSAHSFLTTASAHELSTRSIRRFHFFTLDAFETPAYNQHRGNNRLTKRMHGFRRSRRVNGFSSHASS